MTSSQPTEWPLLRHAYGEAGDIPNLLSQIADFPVESDWQTKPWFSLWSALYHQGDIYSASIAAVPHIVRTLAYSPARATLSFYLLPASIAIADRKHPVDVPPHIRSDFNEAMAAVGSIAAAALPLISDPDIAMAAQAAVLISQGAYQQAGELLEADA